MLFTFRNMYAKCITYGITRQKSTGSDHFSWIIEYHNDLTLNCSEVKTDLKYKLDRLTIAFLR